MFKRFLSYFFIVFGLIVLWASTSRTAMQFVSEHRDNNKWWGSYQCLNGDLISMSYLDIVKRFNPPVEMTPLKKPDYNSVRNTVLYLHGDSYMYCRNTGRLKDSVFAGLSGFYMIDRNHGMNYHLDSTKRNILVIEVSERYLRAYFSGLQMLDEVCDSVIKKKSIALSGAISHNNIFCAAMLPDFHFSDLFNKYINQNLQCNLFNYNFIMPMFESKAALNYYIFNRASGDVVISKDRNFLFLKETVSLSDIGSSYIPVSEEVITKLVNNFNAIYGHYKQNGFSEVYLSIIPNSATVMQPQGYNNLIPLIQNDARLKMKIIDAYTNFKNSPETLYQPGDTHWNNKGKQLWIDLINEKLVTTAKIN